MQPAITRRRATSDANRQRILEAAQAVFAAEGLEGASLRTIAKTAGYTPGAIYFYYANKEEIYADVLRTSLGALHARIDGAIASSSASVAGRVRAGARALYTYYEERPKELDLGFYLYRGMRLAGLTPALNAELNAQLKAALGAVGAEMHALCPRLEQRRTDDETVALFAQIVGLLLLVHTGRSKVLDVDARSLFESYVARLVARLEND